MAGRRSTVIPLFLAVAAAATAPAPVRADDKAVNVVFAAKVEPETLDAGGAGTLVLTGEIRPRAWLLADPAKFTVTTAAVAGLTWGKMETNAPVEQRDPKFPDAPPAKVWIGRVVVRIPFTLAADSKIAEVAAHVTWTACDEKGCLDPEKMEKPIVAAVRRAEVPAPAPAEAPAADAPAPAPAPAPETPAATTTRLGEIKKEHNVDTGGGKLAVRLTVPADVVGHAGDSVGVDVFFYDDQGRPIRSTLTGYADEQGSLRVTSKTTQPKTDPESLDFVFLVPYAAFPSKGAKYVVEARATLSTRATTKEGAKILAKQTTKFNVE